MEVIMQPNDLSSPLMLPTSQGIIEYQECLYMDSYSRIQIL